MPRESQAAKRERKAERAEAAELVRQATVQAEAEAAAAAAQGPTVRITRGKAVEAVQVRSN